jgi:hypothetical protein
MDRIAMTDLSTVLRDAALAYAQRGWPVFPLIPGSKKPRTEHGFKDASTDPDQINQWWGKWPAANIGLQTGEVVTFDFDVKHGGQGIDTHNKLLAECGPVETLTSTTPSGGRHLLFQSPPDTAVGCRAGLLPGLDIRAHGGYVVLPPSVTEEGAYSWNNSLEPAPMPDPWKRVLLVNGKQKTAPSEPFDEQLVLDGISAGQRDDKIWRYSCLLAARGVPLEAAVQRVLMAAAACKPPFDPAVAVEKVFRAYRLYGPPEAGTESLAKQAFGKPASDEPGGFGLIRLDALIKNLTGTQYLIKPYLERDCVGTLFGDSDTYKSFICLDIGLHLATGIKYYGHKVNQCPVVYIAGEGHGGIGRRVLAWLNKHKRRPDEVPFYVSTVPAQFIEEAKAFDIAKVIKATCPENPGLIIIDTLSTNIGDGDESDNKDMSRLLSNVNLFIRAPTGACVIIVAHVGHSDKERERGAYCLRGNVDFRILTKRDGIPQDRRCSMFSLKTKDGPLFPPASFQAEVVTLPLVLDSEGEASTSIVIDSTEYVPAADVKKMPEKNEQCLAILEDLTQQAPGGKVKATAWFDECVRKKVVQGKDSNSRRAQFGRTKSQLKTAGRILVDASFVSLPCQEVI